MLLRLLNIFALLILFCTFLSADSLYEDEKLQATLGKPTISVESVQVDRSPKASVNEEPSREVSSKKQIELHDHPTVERAHERR